MDYHQIITIEPDKRSGRPCIRGTRMTVTDVLEYLAGGMTHAELLAEFPDLTEDDIRACRRPRAAACRAVCMKLLFDQNLSPRLPLLLGNLYPGSVHVREVHLSTASDTAIWEYAKRHEFTIVSKDSDFQRRSLLFGHPPNFVGCALGTARSE